MTLRLVLLTAAASLVVFFGLPADAQPDSSSADPRAEQAADEAVAEARAEVVAEARAEAEAEAEADAEAGAAAITPVTISDVREGSPVRDTEGGLVGTIESVNEQGAVVSTGRLRARLPFSSFGKNDSGLVISLTREQLEAAARTPS